MRKKLTGILLGISLFTSGFYPSVSGIQEIFAETENYHSEPLESDETGYYEEQAKPNGYSEDFHGTRPEEVLWPEDPVPGEEIMGEIESDSDMSSVDSVNPDSFFAESSTEDLFSAVVFPDDSFAEAEMTESEEENKDTEETMQVLAFAPVALAADFASVSMLAAEQPQYYRVENGGYLNVDEVSKLEFYREIIYIDSDGIERRSPLYCMQANLGGMPGETIKQEAIRALNDSAIRKLLYFGYGGPGDICSAYDPTCSHIDWNRADNRYIFTHMALSKVYSGQYGDSNEYEYEHCGVNRFISKILSMTIPARDGIVFTVNNGYGESVTSRNLPLNLRLFRKTPDDWRWVDTSVAGFSNGLQISYNIKVNDTAKAGNSIVIRRTADCGWQLGYWTSKADFQERGQSNPRVLKIGEQVELKDGFYFCLALPADMKQERTLSYSMTLRPVSYLIVDGSVQTGKDNIQDFGAYVYQGARGSASLKLKPYAYGQIRLNKVDVRSGKSLAGAVYQLYAADTVLQFAYTTYKKDELIVEGTTDASGMILWNYLVPGQYYVKEKSTVSGYLLDTEKYPITVSARENQIKVTDIPDVQGKVEIRKKDAETGINLEGAEFTLYQWDNSQRKYINAGTLTYDTAKSVYMSEYFGYTELNQGKFQIVETKNPAGYTGSYAQNFTLDALKPGEKKTFSYQVENTKVSLPHVEIRKIDAETQSVLPDAEFQIFPWNSQNKTYERTGISLTYQTGSQKYVSGDLSITELNAGRYLIKETRNPEGYTGNWEQEIDLNGGQKVYQFTVTNNLARVSEGRIRLTKKDGATGAVLSDAVFEILEWNKQLQKYDPSKRTEMRFDEKEEAYYSEMLSITQENEGKYFVREISNPKGYEGNWEKTVVLRNDGETLELTAENARIMGEIILTKKIKEQDIVWAHGNPTFILVVEGNDETGIWHKWEKTVVFYPGCYDTDGSGYAVLNTILTSVPLGNYKIYEKPVLRYYLQDAYANTSNVQVHAGQKPGYGVNPSNVYNVSAVLTSAQKNAGATFVNKKSRYDGFSHTDQKNNTISIKPDTAS